MTRRLALLVVFAAAAAAPAVVSAQTTAKTPQVPAAYLPPKGLCRIWLDGVPADKQPAPTDCATALRNKPATGQVVFPLAEPSKPVQSGTLRQQSFSLPRNSLVSPSRTVAPPRSGSASKTDTSKAARDAAAKAKREAVPKKPPPPQR